jgi:oligosaccharide repeat unit polymerase
MRAIALFTFVLGLASSAYMVVSQGWSVGQLISIAAISELGQQLSYARYELLEAPPLIVRVATGAGLFGSLVGGALWVASTRGIDRIASLLTLLPGAVMAIITTGKGNFLTPLLLWLSSYLATSVYAGRIRRLFRPGRLLLYGGSGLGLLVFFALLQMARYGWTDLSLAASALNRIRAYAFSQLSAFSSWLHGLSGPPDPTLGAYTFAGPYDALGLRARELGTFSDMVALGPPDLVGNVYTLFRGLITDYTLPGAITVLFLTGIAYSIAYNRVRRGSLIAVPVLASGYALFMWSIFVSVFVNNSTILAYILFMLYIGAGTVFATICKPRHRVE